MMKETLPSPLHERSLFLQTGEAVLKGIAMAPFPVAGEGK
jgi:hypothetical protein